MESLVKHPTLDPQQELLHQYCAKAETLIGTATTAEEARKIGTDLCSRFRRECESTLVVAATEAYIEGIIAKLFFEKP